MVIQNSSGRLRKITFWSLSTTLFLAILAIDLADWEDPCLVVYGVDTFVALICGWMFADWWRVKGSATSIYKWLTFLLFAVAYNDAVMFVARYVYVHEKVKYSALVDSVWWSYRSIPKLCALVYLLSFAIWQRFGKAGTYHDGVRKDMANGFEKLDAQIIGIDMRLVGHTHEGLEIGAKVLFKIPLKVKEDT